eukprot:CAMPEP_0170173928 /NCGR_PEP_ID=MMETSP0040_2-20121228/7193_1 /TAXON_ID=641309 /ORGANISM="Lotharella oceanica, Strain CCMP622" /LENGTH=35 /DNA_ID= /DNA_START= /DNA_END= /DNA_ORIENTATION=
MKLVRVPFLNLRENIMLGVDTCYVLFMMGSDAKEV